MVIMSKKADCTIGASIKPMSPRVTSVVMGEFKPDHKNRTAHDDALLTAIFWTPRRRRERYGFEYGRAARTYRSLERNAGRLCRMDVGNLNQWSAGAVCALRLCSPVQPTQASVDLCVLPQKRISPGHSVLSPFRVVSRRKIYLRQQRGLRLLSVRVCIKERESLECKQDSVRRYCSIVRRTTESRALLEHFWGSEG